jgi:toxin ParE1/3/4
MNVVYADRARRDISEIYDSIATHNQLAARRVEDFIRTKCERLTEFPFASAKTDEAGVRRIPLVRFPYTIFYRVNAAVDRIEIVRVIHGARLRDLSRLPNDDDGL